MMEPKDLVARLGGPTKLAQAVGSTASAVGIWRAQGVPFRYHARLYPALKRRKWTAEQIHAALHWRPGK